MMYILHDVIYQNPRAYGCIVGIRLYRIYIINSSCLLLGATACIWVWAVGFSKETAATRASGVAERNMLAPVMSLMGLEPAAQQNRSCKRMRAAEGSHVTLQALPGGHMSYCQYSW